MTKGKTVIEPFQHSVEQLKEIIELQADLNAADFNLAAFMQIIVNKVQALTKSQGAVVELLEGDDMIYSACSGSMTEYVNLRLKTATNLSGMCITMGRMLYSEDTATDPRVDAAACKKMGVASMVVVPLFRRGYAIGALKIVSNKAYAFGIHDIQTLQLIAMLLGGALGQQIEMEGQRQRGEQYRQMAHYDSLTGLPNRQLLYDRLSHALARSARNKRPLALMYMDIDHFKTVNDSYGHTTGDALLVAFAARIRKCVRASDTFARLGGDEFVLIAEDIKNAQDAECVAEKIIEALQPELDLDGRTFALSTSIGIIVTTGAAMEMSDLVQAADKALYSAKSEGRGRFHLVEAQ